MYCCAPTLQYATLIQYALLWAVMHCCLSVHQNWKKMVNQRSSSCCLRVLEMWCQPEMGHLWVFRILDENYNSLYPADIRIRYKRYKVWSAMAFLSEPIETFTSWPSLTNRCIPDICRRHTGGAMCTRGCHIIVCKCFLAFSTYLVMNF